MTTSSSTGLPSTPEDDAGVEGNTRLTSATAVVLLVMLAVEGYTVLDVRGLITLHVFLGIMLVGPVVLKIGSTLYRFVRYYTGHQAYVRKGPPHPVLRVLGPFVTLTSLALLGTGIGLLAVDPGKDSLLLTAHKVSFFLWFAVMAVHVLGHLKEAFVESWLEVRQFSSHQALRLVVVAVSLAVGVGLGAALLPSASSWTSRPHDSQQDGHHRDR